MLGIIQGTLKTMPRFALAVLLALSMERTSYAGGPPDKDGASERNQLVQQILHTEDSDQVRALMLNLGRLPKGVPALLEIDLSNRTLYTPLAEVLTKLHPISAPILLRIIRDSIDTVPSKLLKLAVEVLSSRPNNTVSPLLEEAIKKIVAKGPSNREKRDSIYDPPFDEIYATEALALANNRGGLAVIQRFAHSPDPRFRRLAVDGFQTALFQGTYHHSERLRTVGREGLRTMSLDPDEEVAYDAFIWLKTSFRASASSKVEGFNASAEDVRVLLLSAVRARRSRAHPLSFSATHDLVNNFHVPVVQITVKKSLASINGDPTLVSLWREFIARLDGGVNMSTGLVATLRTDNERSGVARLLLTRLFEANVKSEDDLVEALAGVAREKAAPLHARLEALSLIRASASDHGARVLDTLIEPADIEFARLAFEALSLMPVPEAARLHMVRIQRPEEPLRLLAVTHLPEAISLPPATRLECLRALLNDSDSAVANQAAEGIMRVTQTIKGIESDQLLYKRTVAQLMTSSIAREFARTLISKLTNAERKIKGIEFAEIVAEEVPSFPFGTDAMQEVAEGDEELFKLYVRRILIEMNTKKWGVLPEFVLGSLEESRKDVLPILLALARGTNGSEKLRQGEWAARVEAIRVLATKDGPDTSRFLVDILAADYASGEALLEGKAVGGVIENGLYNRYLKSNIQESFYEYIKAHLAASPTLSEEHKLLQVYRRAESVGIMFPNRFVADVRDRLLSELERPTRDGRPLALLLYPKTDWNGAFSEDSDMARDLLEKGYRVVYQEAGYVAQLKMLLVENTRDQKADIVVIGGHGTEQSLDLGAQKLIPTEMGMLFDEGSLGAFQKDGVLVFVSCSVGAVKQAASNLVNAARKHIPTTIIPEGRIFGPIDVANFKEWIFDPNGKVIDVKYSDPVETYRASAAPLRKPGIQSRSARLAD